jgi:His/Glu/Gln/Arg/opine family amino acid ABC transporter permease subunit
MSSEAEILIDHVARFSAALLVGAATAIEITLGALATALTMGLALAIVKWSRARLAVMGVDAFIEIFRGVPALTQLFILYYGLAYLGIRIAPIPAAIIGLGLIGAANLAEVFGPDSRRCITVSARRPWPSA